MKRRRFPVLLSDKEYQALQALAIRDGLSKAAALRRLLRKEARRSGLWLLHSTQGYEHCQQEQKESGQ